jgi:hypothetical protein
MTGQVTPDSEEQALIVKINLNNDDPGAVRRVFDIEDEVITVLEASQGGEYDGNEIGGGSFTLFMYGRSADLLFETTLPVLMKIAEPGSYAIKRYGKPGAREERVMLAR